MAQYNRNSSTDTADPFGAIGDFFSGIRDRTAMQEELARRQRAMLRGELPPAQVAAAPAPAAPVAPPPARAGGASGGWDAPMAPPPAPAVPKAYNSDGSSVNPTDDRVRIISSELDAARARVAANPGDQRSAEDVAGLTRELASLGGGGGGAAMRSSLRGGTQSAPNAYTTGGSGTGVTPTINGGLVPPQAINWQARSDALAKQYEAANAPPDMTSLIAEGKRRGGEGMNNLMLAMAAQQAGKEQEPMAGAFLKRAMALQDPVKFSGGQVDENGNVVMDPGYKRTEQLAHLDRQAALNDKGQLAEQNAAMVYQQHLDRNASLESMVNARVAGAQGVADAKAGQGKTMKESTIDKIANMDTSHAQIGALAAAYKPAYARNIPGLGSAENWLGQVAGTDAGNWWSGVMDNQNAILKELSGSAVTASEAARFRAAHVNPNTPPDRIPQMLAQQQQIIALAKEKLLRAHEQGGYNVGGFERNPGAAAPAYGAPGGGGGGGAPAGGGGGADPLGIRK